MDPSWSCPNLEACVTTKGVVIDSVANLYSDASRDVELISQGVLGTATTAQTDFDLQKNGVSFGTMRFAAAATVATFISAAGATFAAGDILKVISPNPADATAADLGFSLAGTR